MSWAQRFHSDGGHLWETAWQPLTDTGLAGQVERQEIVARCRPRTPVLRRMRDDRELDWPFAPQQLLAFYHETK